MEDWTTYGNVCVSKTTVTEWHRSSIQDMLMRMSLCCMRTSIPMWLTLVRTHGTLCWKFLDHLPYNLDLSPYDFHVFGSLKKVLMDHRFGSNKDDKAVRVQWFQQQTREFFARSHWLMCPWDACLSAHGATLMASTPLHWTVPEWVWFEHAVYYTSVASVVNEEFILSHEGDNHISHVSCSRDMFVILVLINIPSDWQMRYSLTS